MVACLFVITGIVAPVPLQERKAVNANWYTTICLPKVFQEIRKNNKKSRIILHHENASSHTSWQIMNFLKGGNIEIMGH